MNVELKTVLSESSQPQVRYGKCSDCGRKVILPCHICRTEREGTCGGPEDVEENESDYTDLDLRLSGGKLKRYEYVRYIRDEFGMTFVEYEAQMKTKKRSPKHK